VSLLLGLSELLHAAPRAPITNTICQPRPKVAVNYVDQKIRNLYEQRKVDETHQLQFPDTVIFNNLSTDISVERQSGAAKLVLNYEGVLRPQLLLKKNKAGEVVFDDNNLPVTESPTFDLFNLIQFKLDRARHMMYVCFTFNENHADPVKMTIYFMLAYGLVDRPQKLTSNEDENYSDMVALQEAADNHQGYHESATGDWLFGAGSPFRSKQSSVARITRVPISLVPLSALTSGSAGILERIPFFGKWFTVPAAGLRMTDLIFSRLNEVLGAGVERIVVTSSQIEFATSVNLERPERAKVLYTLKLDSKDYKPGGRHR
jgi:hypothetical protein